MKRKINFPLKIKIVLVIFSSVLLFDKAFCFSSSSRDLIENKPDSSIKNFEHINLLYLNYIKSINEDLYNKFKVQFDLKYKGYFIINTCRGKFSYKSQYGYNMTLVNQQTKIVAYIVVMVDEKGNSMIFELQKFGIDFTESGYIKGRGGENICLSSNEARKIRDDYSKGSNETGRFTNLNPRTNLDVACGAPVGGDMEFNCFEYDKWNRQFRNIGGWQNE